MDAFTIHGGAPLSGRVRVNGSKNAALPILAAALLTDEPVTIRDVPRLADISNMLRLLERLGCTIDEHESNGMRGLTIDVEDESDNTAPYDVVRTMRASVCVLGPLLARRGMARVSLPGGCAIGDRPIDLHLRGLEALGARITLEGGDVVARTPPTGRLIGKRLFLGGANGPTVLGTANIMCAATLAKGTTIIEGAACEPEVVDLAKLLNAMGAQVMGAGTPRITVEGVERLHGATHTVIPDRIEAGTFLIAAGITNGKVTLENCPSDALVATLDQLERVGVHVMALPGRTEDPMRETVEVQCERRLKPTIVTTQPHPGFPTDLQAQMMALLCVADGNSVITERIFEQRFLHVAELGRMGANLFHQGPTVVVSGVRELIGAPVMASDLRASACLIIAGLAARGQTTVRRVYHLDRGYESMEKRLNSLGALIERVDEKQLVEI
ncbi:MAG: UDP-N-acetylglucosamine 1-carboxyvinyltransferase [Phycisphaerales bacterium]|nr:UDP-N-acetylglucosamine 1-carboxyvinyltransferase [Phycisphaerales bacterium]